jgi:phage terminase small subunit
MKSTKLSIKEQRFVKHYASNGNGKESVIAAGYGVSNSNSAKTLATKILKRERVKKALTEEIENAYPDFARLSARAIISIIESESSRPLEKLKAIEVLIKIFGWANNNQESAVTVQHTFALPTE